MTERERAWPRRAWRAVVGVTLLAAGSVVLAANANGAWPVPGLSTFAAVAGVFAVGFALAALLRALAGSRASGVGHLLAMVGWLLLLVGELVAGTIVTAVGVAVVLAAGAYLAWLGLG